MDGWDNCQDQDRKGRGGETRGYMQGQVTVIVMAIGEPWAVVKLFDMVRVVGELNSPAGIFDSEVGETAKHGLVPLNPHVPGSPSVIAMVGVSPPVPVLLMHK